MKTANSVLSIGRSHPDPNIFCWIWFLFSMWIFWKTIYLTDVKTRHTLCIKSILILTRVTTKTRATESFWNTFCIGQTKFVVFFENVKLFKKAQLIVLDWLSDTQFFFVWFKTIVIWWFRNQNLKHQGKHNYF